MLWEKWQPDFARKGWAPSWVLPRWPEEPFHRSFKATTARTLNKKQVLKRRQQELMASLVDRGKNCLFDRLGAKNTRSRGASPKLTCISLKLYEPLINIKLGSLNAILNPEEGLPRQASTLLSGPCFLFVLCPISNSLSFRFSLSQQPPSSSLVCVAPATLPGNIYAVVVFFSPPRWLF